jgi:hypothetical protein
MSAIDRVGSFRGKVIDRGISETKNGFPQLVLQLVATEKWDEQAEVWVDWSQFDVTEATAYMCLFGKNKKATLAVNQAMKAFGWDGASLLDLQENEALADQIQWRMAENTYEGDTKIQVAWIDEYDAVPGRKVKKLEKADIKKLDGMYASALKAVSGGPKPKKAAPTPPTARPEPSPDPTPASEEASSNTPSPAPKPPAPAAPKAAKKSKAVDKDTAWSNVYAKGNGAGKTDIEISQAWTEAVKTAGDDEAVEGGCGWASVQISVLEALGL